MKEIKLRRNCPSDENFIVETQLAMALESENLQLDPNTLRRGVKKVLEDSTIGFYSIADCETQPVGVMLVLKEWSDWRNAWIYWIHSLYVLPEFRKQNVFRKMYEQLQSDVTNDPSTKGIRLYVDKKNHSAQKVYQNLRMNGEHYHMYEWLK